MQQRQRLLIVSVVLLVGLGPALFAGGAVADDPASGEAQPAQSGLFEELIDAVIGDDSDDESGDDGGLFDQFLGESFDGYPDGFSEDGIDDFEQALGEQSVHYTADSLAYEAEGTTPDGDSFEMSAQASADTERALIVIDGPDGERAHYLDGDEGFVRVDGDYQRESASFDRDELYAVTELERDLQAANLTEDSIDGDTVIYTAEERTLELAVRDTGELDYMEIDDDESVFIDFYDYDATTVDEPAWVEDARELTDEPDPQTEQPLDEPEPRTEQPVDDPSIQEEIERHVPDSAEPGTRIQIVTADGHEVTVVIGEDGEPEAVERRDSPQTDGPTDAETRDRDRTSEEQLHERAEMLEERIQHISEQIERLEDQDRTDDHDASDRIADLEAQIDRHQERIDRMEAEIAEFETGEREAALREEIADLEDEREELEAERDELRDRYAEADDEELEARLREEIEQVLGEIGTVNREIERAEQQLESLDPDAEIAQRENRIEASQNRIADLRERIERIEQRGTADDTDQIERLEEHKEELEAELEAIEDRIEASER